MRGWPGSTSSARQNFGHAWSGYRTWNPIVAGARRPCQDGEAAHASFEPERGRLFAKSAENPASATMASKGVMHVTHGSEPGALSSVLSR